MTKKHRADYEGIRAVWRFKTSVFFSWNCLKSSKITFPWPEKQYIVSNITDLEKYPTICKSFLNVFYQLILESQKILYQSLIFVWKWLVRWTKMACQVAMKWSGGRHLSLEYTWDTYLALGNIWGKSIFSLLDVSEWLEKSADLRARTLSSESRLTVLRELIPSWERSEKMPH